MNCGLPSIITRELYESAIDDAGSMRAQRDELRDYVAELNETIRNKDFAIEFFKQRIATLETRLRWVKEAMEE